MGQVSGEPIQGFGPARLALIALRGRRGSDGVTQGELRLAVIVGERRRHGCLPHPRRNRCRRSAPARRFRDRRLWTKSRGPRATTCGCERRHPGADRSYRQRSEEHTSELQSLAYLVCRLLLEKKKKQKQKTIN